MRPPLTFHPARVLRVSSGTRSPLTSTIYATITLTFFGCDLSSVGLAAKKGVLTR